MKANDEAEKDSGMRAGGDVVIKSASQMPHSEQAAGGDVESKGQSHDGKRAGGDVVIKGPSQRDDSAATTNEDGQ